jgi:hypothetical protein
MAPRCPQLLAHSLVVIVAACVGPDLVVTEHAVNWTASQKSATTRVANVGNDPAGPFLVYVNGEEDPESANHRPQVRHPVPGLAVNAAVELVSDFLPLSHADNHLLANVRSVRVIVDPKSSVAEFDETNNERTVGVGPCTAVQSCLSTSGHLYVGGATTSSTAQKVGQTFLAPQDGLLCGIELTLGRYNATTFDELTLRLFDGDTLLATATKSGATIPLTWATVLPPLDPVLTGVG